MMDDPNVMAGLGAAAALGLVGLLTLLLAGFRPARLRAALNALRGRSPAPPPPSSKPSGEPLRLLAALQREGRLVDFLMEDLSAATDEQVGHGVRLLHAKCQKVLTETLVLEPAHPGTEGGIVEVPAGFDPSAVRVTGNVTGQPPYRGTLKHPGWRVKHLKLPAPPAGQDLFVLEPAEVELA